MPILRFNVPEEIAQAARVNAKTAGKSLPAYLADLVRDRVENEWPPDFFESVIGGWKGGSVRRSGQGYLERRDRI